MIRTMISIYALNIFLVPVVLGFTGRSVKSFLTPNIYHDICEQFNIDSQDDSSY